MSPEKHVLRWRVAFVVDRAVHITGSRRSLAQYLGVSVTSIAQWLHATADVPDGAWDRILELLQKL
jgi:DNA-binding transcriptional regulator YdaS (Cro superfamily)